MGNYIDIKATLSAAVNVIQKVCIFNAFGSSVNKVLKKLFDLDKHNMIF